MMKNFKYSFLALVAMFVATACTHNDGDINGWYGTWHIDAIEGDQPTHEGTYFLNSNADYYLQFQSSVMCLRYTDSLHDGGESYGAWYEDENGKMHFDFNGNFDVQNIFPQHCTLTVVKHNGDKAELSLFVNPDDQELDNKATSYTYFLTRQP